jgi:hypothetical protein
VIFLFSFCGVLGVERGGEGVEKREVFWRDRSTSSFSIFKGKKLNITPHQPCVGAFFFGGSRLENARGAAAHRLMRGRFGGEGGGGG